MDVSKLQPQNLTNHLTDSECGAEAAPESPAVLVSYEWSTLLISDQ